MSVNVASQPHFLCQEIRPSIKTIGICEHREHQHPSQSTTRTKTRFTASHQFHCYTALYRYLHQINSSHSRTRKSVPQTSPTNMHVPPTMENDGQQVAHMRFNAVQSILISIASLTIGASTPWVVVCIVTCGILSYCDNDPNLSGIWISGGGILVLITMLAMSMGLLSRGLQFFAMWIE